MPDELIDLRSDTVTRPTPAMRKVMAEAEVGDDVCEDDPTINRLQRRFAEMTGKAAALFTPSGTMANQIAIKCHTSPGDEVICERFSHILHHEVAGFAALSGVSATAIDGEGGTFTPQQLEEKMRVPDIHHPLSRLVVLENTANLAGGTVWPIDQMRAVCARAQELGLARHLDGARIHNAVVASGVPLRAWCDCVDSISVCFSKSLGAPVGSILAGEADFIARAKRTRKMFGGGMRQAGILAAAAEYALDNHVDRLAEDHENARVLAGKLAECEHFEVEHCATNMVYWSLKGTPGRAGALVADCAKRGVLFYDVSPTRFRAVTHLDVNRKQVLAAAGTICQAVMQG